MIEIVTKMEIAASVAECFDAFVNPEKIGNFWFSSSSARWEKDRTIELEFSEYGAAFPIQILDLRENSKISFTWGPASNQRVVLINFDAQARQTIVEVREQGFQEIEEILTNDDMSGIRQSELDGIMSDLMGNKGGWTFVLSCLKAYLENGVSTLRTGLIR